MRIEQLEDDEIKPRKAFDGIFEQPSHEAAQRCCKSVCEHLGAVSGIGRHTRSTRSKFTSLGIIFQSENEPLCRYPNTRHSTQH